MITMKPQTPRPVLRPATLDDEPFVRDLSGEVFDIFGHYDEFLPRYLDHPDINTTVAEVGTHPVGFVMAALVMGKADPPDPGSEKGATPHGRLGSGPPDAQPIDVEIVAIAVQPAWHGRGVGRLLMDHVLAFANAHARFRPLRSVQLNVAHTNERALAFFRHYGFYSVNEEDGYYPKGQRSIRMARPLSDE